MNTMLRKWNCLESVFGDSYAAVVKTLFNFISFTFFCVMLTACGKKVEVVKVTEKRSFLAKYDQEKVAMDVPDYWRRSPDDIPGKEFRRRLLSYQFGKEGGEIYISYRLSGTFDDNVNRWLSQFGKDPIESTDELEAIEVAGESGYYLIETYGVFSVSRMSGGISQKVAERPEWGLLGVYGQNAFLGTFSIKMTGPADEIRAERANFLKACKTLRLVEIEETGDE